MCLERTLPLAWVEWPLRGSCQGPWSVPTQGNNLARFSRIVAAMSAQLRDRNNGKNLYVYWGQCRSQLTVSFNVSSDSQTLRGKGSLLRMSEWIRAAGRGACRMPSLLKAKASRSWEFAGEFEKLKLVCPAFKTQIQVYG